MTHECSRAANANAALPHQDAIKKGSSMRLAAKTFDTSGSISGDRANRLVYRVLMRYNRGQEEKPKSPSGD